ncbi:glucoamylase family protein [Ensifer sp. 22564]|uniref:glucoamylase family protein n=1 Tax=Ensifer sp. 22564 TaxID=3453943 RepID=UPI003F86AA74
MLKQTENAELFQTDGLQKAAFGYFLDHADPATGLIADTSLPGAPSSIAATGFGLSCYPIGVERGWISRREAIGRVLTTLRFLAESPQSRDQRASGYRGFYYHFLDMRTGERTWRSELSTVDTALLIAGCLTASAFFSGEDTGECEIRTLAERLYARVDWRWALNRSDTLTMGWRPPGRFLKHRWRGYSEALLLYVLALGAPDHAIEPEHYTAFTEGYDWIAVDGGPHLHAAPLFIHLFPQAWLDLRGLGDRPMRERGTDYFENTQRAIALQRDHARRNSGRFAGYGQHLWGLSACHAPRGRLRLKDGRWQRLLGYVNRGAPFGPDDGTLVPWAAAACLPFDPDASLSALGHVAAGYPGLLKEGRFPGGFNPSLAGEGPAGWIDERVVGLDQGLVVMMIENWRSGFVWELTRSLPAIRRGLERAGYEGGWLATETA